MIPAPLGPPMPIQQAMKPGQVEVEQLQLIEQLGDEMLLTVQAFQRLHAALQDRMPGK